MIEMKPSQHSPQEVAPVLLDPLHQHHELN